MFYYSYHYFFVKLDLVSIFVSLFILGIALEPHEELVYVGTKVTHLG